MLKVFCLNFRFTFAETRATRFNQSNRFMFFPVETWLCLFSRAWHQLYVLVYILNGGFHLLKLVRQPSAVKNRA